ncbi:MAG: TonB-dependent receptor [Robiginitomaculum sp.]
MKILSFKTQLALSVSTLMVTGSLSMASFAQEDGVNKVDEVITTGTRRKARSAADAPAPVDVISAAEFSTNASTDIGDMLRTAVPSYNVNAQPISDAATIIRPANLRGLSPDNTLVLLNGKRRHRGSVISFLGGGISDGSQGVDVGVFPALGLKQIEVLRDGASSQYGSDAIAGVMNFVLDDSREGGSVEVRYGQTYKGDGDTYRIAGNIGLPLGDTGFVNITGEYGQSNGTFRAVQRGDAADLIEHGFPTKNKSVNTITPDYTQYWGQPDVKDNIKLFVNTGIELSENVEAYAFGNYATRNVEGGFFYRNPTNRGGVFKGPKDNGVATLKTLDLTQNDATPCPVVHITDTDGDGHLDTFNASELAALNADPNCTSFLKLFPGGFVPRFGGDNRDIAITGGFRGELDFGNGLGYDISGSYGSNKTDFFIRNTINASLGLKTPTSFVPGAYEQKETAFNLDLIYGVPIEGWASDLSIATGFEYRKEQFDITAGDPASYAIGPYAKPSPDYPNGQGFSSSSNGFGGFTRSSSNSQSNIAVYGELEADVTEFFTVQAAVRYTNYDNKAIGSTTNWKVGGLYKVTDDFRVRGTYSTGFHAPTAGQANVVNVTTAFNAQGVLSDQGTVPLSSAAGQFINKQLGGKFSLGPEKAKNMSAGLAFNFGGAAVTIDAFNIDVKDRIALTDPQPFRNLLVKFGLDAGVAAGAGGIGLTDINGDGKLDVADAASVQTSQVLNAVNGASFEGFTLNSADFAGFEDLTAAGFFANDFDTKTRGIDVNVNMPVDLGVGSSSVSLAMNYTDTKVIRGPNLSTKRRQSLQDQLPNFKGNIAFKHARGMWSGLVRANYHSGWTDTNNGSYPSNGTPSVTKVGGEVTIDAEIGADVRDNVNVTVGVANLFNNYPDENPGQLDIGQLYPESSPFGFNGGQYYAKATYKF